MRRSRRISYLTQSYETNSVAKRRGNIVVGDTPTSPVIRLRRIALATRSLLPRIRSARLR